MHSGPRQPEVAGDRGPHRLPWPVEVSVAGRPFPDADARWSPRQGAVPHSGAARGLGQGAVGRRLSEQQRLSQQPQILAAGVGTQRGVCCCPAEAPGARSGRCRPGPGSGGGRACCVEPGQPPWRGLPGRGPAYLEGNPSPAPGSLLRVWVLRHQRPPGASCASHRPIWCSGVTDPLQLPQTQLRLAQPGLSGRGRRDKGSRWPTGRRHRTRPHLGGLVSPKAEGFAGARVGRPLPPGWWESPGLVATWSRSRPLPLPHGGPRSGCLPLLTRRRGPAHGAALCRWRSGGSACPGSCPRPPWPAPCATPTTGRCTSAANSAPATTWPCPAPS